MKINAWNICALLCLFINKYIIATTTALSKNLCANKPNGYHTTVESNCRSYFYCSHGQVSQNYTCNNGYSFHMSKGKCVPSTEVLCIDIKCPSYNIDKFYIVPHTKCQMYYNCMHGNRQSFLCPDNMSFSFELQTCVKRGLCYDPVCTGRVNGEYPDTTQECTRSFNCTGGKLMSAKHCEQNEIFSENYKRCVNIHYSSTEVCQLPQESAVAFPLHQRKNICLHLDDGVYTIPNTECKDYFICKSHINLGTLTCADGLIFNGKECVLDLYYQCKDPTCIHLEDGIHVDLYTECQDFFYCLNRRLIWRDSCPGNTIYDGSNCVEHNTFKCANTPEGETNVCLNIKDGYHRNNAICNEYFYCSKNELILRGTCPLNQVWNGNSCVDQGWFYCDGPTEWIGCLVRDGFYADTSPKSQCSQYYYCTGGKVTRYACSSTESFNGEKCVPKHAYKCPVSESNTCNYLADGYHPDFSTNCESYFYCSEGIKNVFLCQKNEVFNGQKCVHQTQYKCPLHLKKLSITNNCSEKSNGYHILPNTNCQKYVYCQDGTLINEFSCAQEKVFDNYNNYCVFSNCSKKLNTFCEKDGFYLNPDSNCRSYHFCIDGQRTDLECPTSKLFNGQVCVSSEHYKCPEHCDRYSNCLYQ